jgi:hypothetical protein
MNCLRCQRLLLLAENPEFPEFKVQTHLGGCQACREFQRQLLLIEGNVPRVPVPSSSSGKERLLRALLQPPVAQTLAPRPAAVIRPDFARPAGSGSPFARWAAVGVAACVLIAAGILLGQWLSQAPPNDITEPGPQAQVPQNNGSPGKNPGPNKQIQDPFKKEDKKPSVPGKSPALLAKLVECDLKLAAPESERQRIEALAAMAEALHQETQILAKSAKPAELMKLAQMYKRVVHNGLVARAQDLPMEERGEVLKVVTVQLVAAGREAERQARLVPASAAAFTEIAAAARAADLRLRELMEAAE